MSTTRTSGPTATTVDVDRSDADYRAWLKEAVRKVQADANRSADTHLLRFPLPEAWGIDLYLKDESTHPTGSLKHRLARSLFLYALCNGWIRPGRPVIEASSGSTAVSEAYFAKLIGVPFIAVMPRTTSPEKSPAHRIPRRRMPLRGRLDEDVRGIGATGGSYRRPLHGPVHLRGAGHRLARQQQHRRIDVPAAAAGTFPRARLDRGHRFYTGGTSATIARYVHYMQHDTRICVPDPENSCFFDGWTNNDPHASSDCGSRIEGIGRPRMEPSFVPGAIDRMMKVPDAASVAACRALETAIGRKAGGSTGTGLWSALKIISEMVAEGRTGSVVTLLCDPGDRYLDKYYSDAWLASQGLDIAPYAHTIETLLATGVWREPTA